MWAKLPKVIMLPFAAGQLCSRPYYNHPRGCPNYHEKLGCPPNIGLLDEIGNYYIIFNKFPFGKHVKKMKAKHPQWSLRQLECCLYWQGRARKQLKEIVADFHRVNNRCIIYPTPEAMGVNVTQTMSLAGIKLEWPPKEFAYQVVLAKQI